ncbi:hypothetical protein KUV62_14935 [Salipiger bermudensis]|uniref:hypothetical protein n=1 Tax=Salipiger bermudensis TaxID=344736 RepID=UPI001C9908C7|nr:hypothetical protein [Salipiger bermudensis]MBY6005217.1 hypothetical protein [Salipiger bermudensis]
MGFDRRRLGATAESRCATAHGEEGWAVEAGMPVGSMLIAMGGSAILTAWVIVTFNWAGLWALPLYSAFGGALLLLFACLRPPRLRAFD